MPAFNNAKLRQRTAPAVTGLWKNVARFQVPTFNMGILGDIVQSLSPFTVCLLKCTGRNTGYFLKLTAQRGNATVSKLPGDFTQGKLTICK